MQNEHCLFCLDDTGEIINTSIFGCSCVYYYHKNCMKTWVLHKMICPICKSSLGDKQNIVVITSHSPQRIPIDRPTCSILIILVILLALLLGIIYSVIFF